jgi:uncharacterized protein (DUF885 family)
MDLEARAEAILAGRGREDESARLRQVFDLWWEYAMTESPEFATYAGYTGQNHRWTDLSLEAIARREREMEVPGRLLASFDRQTLSATDQLDYDLFKHGVDEALEGRRFKGEYMPVSQMQGVQQNVAQMLAMMPTRHAQDYEDVLARLQGVPTLVEQTIVLMRKGLETGITPPRITLRDVPQQILNQVVDDPEQASVLRPFQRFPATVSASEQESLRRRAAEIYTSKVAAAFRDLHAFFVGDYLPRTRETIAMRDLPDGEAWYAFNVRQATTTTLTPEEIHAIGLQEVARIRGQMDAVMRSTGFDGPFTAFMSFLRTDPRFFFERPEDLLRAYRDLAKRADPELVRLFRTLPRLPYGVLPVPAYAEKSQTTAYYEPGSPSAGRPGYFFANTYDLPSRPKWEMEALTLHEAVPGHHLQLALAQEMTGVPEFRKHGFYTAFIEGWGLYSESLGGEMGFYQDPYSRFGQLTYEIWRAIRLVVDTGMHALGWSREQAIAYFEENAGKAEHDIVVEVDRYIVWPAQALAYKIGELRIQELRREAASSLGEAFDVRAFHDQVLLGGALPLEILSTRIRAWLSSPSRV